jgi:hypothetical protein
MSSDGGPAATPTTPPPQARVLVDPYRDWTEGEGIPIHLDFGHNLLALETGCWDRYDARGCFAHTHGAGDFMANYVLEVAPGRKTRPVKHLYEIFCYVLAGHGSTKVWLPDGETRVFEWGPKALFAIPLNCRYQVFNGSGADAVRISCTNDAPITTNLYHNLAFVFDNPFQLPERTGQSRHFEGEGEHGTWVGRNDRHAAGTHVHAVDGTGYSLLWYEGDSEFKEFPWQHGFMYTPPFWMFHQHFNTGPQPARYVACSLGSPRYPFIALRRKRGEGAGSISISQGGRQIEYEEQDPRIHRRWLEALRATGVASEMGETFDEQAILELPPSALKGVIRTPASTGPAV